MRVAIVVLSGIIALLCSWSSIAEDQSSASMVQVSDLRTAAGKKHHRDSVFSAISFLADTTFKPQPVPQLKEKLVTVAAEAMNLRIDELHMIDFFPKRSSQVASGNGWAGSLIYQSLVDSKTNKSVLENMPVPQDEDSVVCILSGSLNDKPVSASSFRVYHLPTLAFLVHTNKVFVEAASGCIEDLAHQLSDSLKATPSTQT